ncbi:MAG: leucine-rich repeat domain-containing protein [Saprospiraceae bacterium]|nr:leucine-rich repeat domain-containing protein [Saprospiraceae bacterium]
MSELALRLIAENKKTKSTYLDLGYCRLTEVPEELGECVWLEKLVLSSMWWELQHNDSFDTRISANFGLEDNHNSISDIPEFFERLINLRSLIMDKAGYGLDSSSFRYLKNLEELDIRSNRISDLSGIQHLAKLKRLYLRQNSITDLSPLADLADIEILDLRFNAVKSLEPIKNLSRLRQIWLNHNYVEDLSPISIDIHSDLEILDIRYTLIASLEPVLPFVKKGMPVKWDWEEGGGIFVEQCALVNPPVEIVRQGSDAILRYFEEQDRLQQTLGADNALIKVREAKVMLVGQGKAGKTTLRRKLENPDASMPAPGDTTRGIEITRLDERMPHTGEPLRLNVWDFGGQDIQHYAHQFFLTGSSLYALVTNERIQDSVHLPYWLNIIEMLGKKSPVVLIQNKDGGHCRPLKDEAAIRARFANVHNRVFQTDLSKAKTEDEFAALRKKVVELASELPHIEREYLRSFNDLREKLETEADMGKHYLRWDDYLALIPELGEDLMRDYANALTFLGVCQYFPHDSLLADYVFLRPKWLIDALFELLLHPSLDASRGHFSENDTRAIWTGSEYRGMHSLLVRMMKEFELCYRVEGDGENYIVPQRLPGENQSYGWNNDGDVPVQYRYKFMPKGILTRLICRLHPRLESDAERGQRVWNDAAIFALPDGKGRVFAREVYSENIVELRATGEKHAEMLNEVIRKMDDINRDAKYDNLQVEKMVPCPCEECRAAPFEERYFFKFSVLEKALDKNLPGLRCDKSLEEIRVDAIFGMSGVKKPAAHRRSEPVADVDSDAPSIRVFISYSHAQREYFPVFKHDFEQYAQIPGLKIKVFADDEIPIGSDWDKHLQDKVARCDMMLLLVSQEFLNSRYIQEKEFGAAVERLKDGADLFVAPVYFAPCSFDDEGALRRLQFFKPHGDEFGQAPKGNKFSYIDLVKFRETDGMPIPNSNRQHYMKEFWDKIRPQLEALAAKL